jgi:predicted unusual protein kinase regulating ubiquinone biosynthesis (AarF/ABC1/UbiB family)
VHVAYGHDGTKYAVKVQHENLKRSAADDMRAVTLMVDLVAKIFKEFSYKCKQLQCVCGVKKQE